MNILNNHVYSRDIYVPMPIQKITLYIYLNLFADTNVNCATVPGDARTNKSAWDTTVCSNITANHSECYIYHPYLCACLF